MKITEIQIQYLTLDNIHAVEVIGLQILTYSLRHSSDKHIETEIPHKFAVSFFQRQPVAKAF